MSASHGTLGKSRRRYAFGGVVTNSPALILPTTGTAEEILLTFTIPKGAIDRDGQGLRFTASFSSASGNSKSATMRFNNGVSGTILASITGTGGVFVLEVILRRVSATTFAAIGRGSTGVAIALVSNLATVIAASGNWDTGDLTVAIDGTSPSAAAEIVLRSLLIEALPETPNPTSI